jgi:hypothetical protein
LVLVAAPTRVLARPSGNWPICYELRSVPPRDDGTAADRSVTKRGAQRAPVAKRIDAANIKRNGFLAIRGHTRRFWNLSGTF